MNEETRDSVMLIALSHSPTFGWSFRRRKVGVVVVATALIIEPLFAKSKLCVACWLS